ncbi:hypothetical protein PRNP1_001699 [Phytophthora ramorum]
MDVSRFLASTKRSPVTETKMDVMMNMTTEDVRRLRGQFTASLDLEAFVRLMKKSLRDRIHSELDFVVGVIELFHTIDVNGDAVLDWDEFTAYMMDAGQAKADFYFEGRGQSDKHYVPLSMPPPDTKTPLRNIATRVHQMRLLADQNAMAYFEASSDVVYIYGLQFDRNDGPRHLSTMRLHTAFAEHIIIDVVYVPTRKSLVTSSILVRGYLSIWSVADLYNPVMTHRLESHAAQEHLCWVPSLKIMATSAVIFPTVHSGKDVRFPTRQLPPECWYWSASHQNQSARALGLVCALNVVVGATSTKLLLWKGDTGALWKTYEYATIVLSTKNPTAVNSHLGTKQADDPESREAQARAITAVCVDDRERKVIVGDDTGSIKVLNAVNGNVMKELDPHTNCVVGVSYVLYGKRVISISSDSVLHICDEDNPQGFYVPFGGGPILSVLLQSLRLLPEIELTSTPQGQAETQSSPGRLAQQNGPALESSALLVRCHDRHLVVANLGEVVLV